MVLVGFEWIQNTRKSGRTSDLLLPTNKHGLGWVGLLPFQPLGTKDGLVKYT